MQAMQDKIDGISNNMSNAETDGYKKVDVSFSDLVYEQLERKGYATNKNGVNQHLTGSGVKAEEWLRNNTQGPLKATDIDTDFAIDGQGFFKVTTNDGNAAYIRAGSFKLDSQGQLTDSNGNRLEVLYSGNEKALTKGNFSVNEAGEITNISTKQIIGKINLYKSVGDDSMYSVGDSLYMPKAGTQVTTVNVKDANIRQGFVEASNVDLGTEMTDLIITQRAFELNSKSLSTVDQMMGIINNLRSK